MSFKNLQNKPFIYIVCLIFLLLFVFIYYIFIGRYHISEPMQDLEYKKAIVRESHNIFYTLENLRPIVGEEELEDFIKSNNNTPEIYTPSIDNIKNGTFKANLHMHTLNSDGKASVKERLDAAQNYAETHLNNGFMYIAITDHNTILGAKEVVEVLQKYPKKYKNIKVILGMEIYTQFKSQYSSQAVEVHVLCWCLNPYDKFLNKEFYKPENANKWNRMGPDRNFDDVILMMSKYSIPGVAHPLRYISKLGKNRELYLEEMLGRYSSLSKKPLFTEAYYQVYPRYYNQKDMEKKILPYTDFVNKTADKYHIFKTGSTDSHSKSILN